MSASESVYVIVSYPELSSEFKEEISYTLTPYLTSETTEVFSLSAIMGAVTKNKLVTATEKDKANLRRYESLRACEVNHAVMWSAARTHRS